LLAKKEIRLERWKCLREENAEIWEIEREGLC